MVGCGGDHRLGCPDQCGGRIHEPCGWVLVSTGSGAGLVVSSCVTWGAAGGLVKSGRVVGRSWLSELRSVWSWCLIGG